MRVTGLSRFHTKALMKDLNTCELSSEIELIFKQRIALRRLDSLWYGGGMADIKYKGYTFHIEATGDVYADLYTVRGSCHLQYVKDKSNRGIFGSEMLSYFRSDKSLERLKTGAHRRYSLDLNHNNWWECFVTDPGGVFHDLMWVLDEDNLVLGIVEVLASLDEIIKELEAAA